MTGLREFIAPCGTSAISRSRMWRSSRFRDAEQVAAVQEDLPAHDPAGRPGQAHQGGAHGGLAGAGLADQPEPLTGRRANETPLTAFTGPRGVW